MNNLKHPYFLYNQPLLFGQYLLCNLRQRQPFFALDQMQGRDLRYHIGRMYRFSEDKTRFFMACVFLSLEYMHYQNIIHRDIKPENLVLVKNGYVRITDFGIARVLRPDNSSDTRGTPGYLAHKMKCRQINSSLFNYFALGVIGYQFMLGKENPEKKRDQILGKQSQIRRSEILDNLSLENKVLNQNIQLIQRKPSNRFGFKGAQELRQHPWFNIFLAHFISHVKKFTFVLIAIRRQISIENEENNELTQYNDLMLKGNSIQIQFDGYDLNNLTLISEPIKQQLNIINY